MEHISQNIAEIQQRIADAAKKANRAANEITLVAVSKTFPAEYAAEAHRCGISNFGENKTAELISKKTLLPSEIKWHMLGHLQTNKVRKIVGECGLIHSLDSLRLAEQINRVSLEKNLITECLVEINIGEETQKFGISPKNTEDFIQKVSCFSNIRIRGLMCVAPMSDFGESNRKFFAMMRKLFIDIQKNKLDNTTMDILSMGMSQDFETAIEEGSNCVRIGTALFGKREYV
jgi:pyridoxal phosphate enzyme (YggS family)